MEKEVFKSAAGDSTLLSNAPAKSKTDSSATMTKIDKVYLMIGGTILPASLGVTLVSLFSKDHISAKSAKYLITFGALAVVGGYFTAQAIKRAETPVTVEKKVAVPVATPAPADQPLSWNESVGFSK